MRGLARPSNSHWYSVQSSRSSQQFSRCGCDLAILALYPIGPRSRSRSPNGPRAGRSAIESAEYKLPQGQALLMALENREPNLESNSLIRLSRLKSSGKSITLVHDCSLVIKWSHTIYINDRFLWNEIWTFVAKFWHNFFLRINCILNIFGVTENLIVEIFNIQSKKGFVAVDDCLLSIPEIHFLAEFAIKIYPGSGRRNSWHDLPSEIVSYGDNIREKESEMKSVYAVHVSRHVSRGNLTQK